jgi:spore coat protein CotH
MLALILLPLLLSGQPAIPDDGPVFKDSIVPRIDILINPDTLQWIYENVESTTEFHAVFIFNNSELIDTVENVGFRLRGNTSLYSAKKSFKISFNAFEPGGKWNGLEKLNLNGEHNDPSVVRSKLCWDLLHDSGIPASRSNHVRVYINGNYYGLYINVEHVDEQFVDSRFGNNDGNLYKCLWPADLDYLGSNPEAYKITAGDRRVYELKTNTQQDDYTDLAHFIDVLNNTPDEDFRCEMEKVFNIHDYLKIIAIDIFTGNWDGHIYNKNNFYLYHNTETGKFEYIPYDLDNTYGIDWMGKDWGTRDIYDWEQHGGEVRPLYTRIMDNQALKDQYSFYVNKLTTGLTPEEVCFPKIDSIRNKIAPFILNDPYYPLDYGFTYTDFLNSFSQALGGHVAYGIKPYIHSRDSSNLSQADLNNMNPVIKFISHSALIPNQDFWVRAYIEDEDASPEVRLNYTINNGNPVYVFMYDDGGHEDDEAGDKVYGGLITNITNTIHLEYQVFAVDNYGYSSVLPCEPVILELIPSEQPDLFINEFLADNDSAFADEYGEFDDWIELFNADADPVWLGDKYLSDNFANFDKWLMPDITLQPGEFILFWADNDPEQGANHTNFNLEKNGEEIAIFDSPATGYKVIDSITFGTQSENVSYGRNPDGGPVWQFFSQPTPNAGNLTGSVSDDYYSENQLKIFPNPVTSDRVYFSRPIKVRIFDLPGVEILHKDSCSFIDVTALDKGLYLLVTDDGFTIKLIIQ